MNSKLTSNKLRRKGAIWNRSLLPSYRSVSYYDNKIVARRQGFRPCRSVWPGSPPMALVGHTAAPGAGGWKRGAKVATQIGGARRFGRSVCVRPLPLISEREVVIWQRERPNTSQLAY